MDKKPFCAHPWIELMIWNSGQFGPCCAYVMGKPTDSFSHSDLLETFNSPEMVELRKRLISSDIKLLPCEHCTTNIILKSVPQVPEWKTENRDVFDNAKDAFEKGLVRLDYLPLHLSLHLSQTCNIRCTFCSQAQHVGGIRDRNFPTKGIISSIKKEGWKNISRFRISGGEPFLNQDGLELIDFLATERPEKTRVSIITNGTLIKKHIDKLSKIPFLELQLSIDGFQDTYEDVRVGAKWSKVVDGINLLSKLKEKNPQSLFSFSLNHNEDNSAVH